MEVSQNRDTPTCFFYNGKSENDMDDLGVALWLRKPPYLRNPQPGILDGPSSVWIYARVQKFWPRKKTRLRWFVQICNFAAPNNKKSFNLRGFIQENTSTKHPLSIEASNIKPLAIRILKKQTGSMDSFHASCEGLKGPHFIHLFKLQISHNPHTGLQPNRRGAWFIHETTLTSQPGRERLLS